jgi:hypothetical protein
MCRFRTILWLFSVVVLAAALKAQDQDSAPSLGEAARKARLQRRRAAQATDTQSTGVHLSNSSAEKNTAEQTAADQDVSAKNPPPRTPKRVITNDEIPEHIGPTSTLPTHAQTPSTPDLLQDYRNGEIPPEYWKNQIQNMKDAIADLHDQIRDLEGPSQNAGANCIANCVEWNQQQREKQQQLEMMKAQLEQEQKGLEQVQEMARKQGFGSSVYDP